MLQNAVPAKIVSAMLGHSSIGITMDTYSHVLTDMQEGATSKMNTLLKSYISIRISRALCISIMWYLFTRKRYSKSTESLCSRCFYGGVGGIRTLGRLLTVTRFPVVLVMTASILLRIGALDSKNDYTKNHSKVKHKFEKCAIF
jgi:hypothetical protein